MLEILLMLFPNSNIILCDDKIGGNTYYIEFKFMVDAADISMRGKGT